MLIGLVSFLLLSSETPAPVVFLWAVVVGVASLWFVRFIDTNQGEAPSETVSMIVASSALAFGWIGKLVVPAELAHHHWYDAAAVVVGAGAAWLADALTAQSAAVVCFVCKEPAGTAVFTCPRCKQAICSKPYCWHGRHFRCRYCDERDVILFPVDETWWQSRVGTRVKTGSCCHCYEEAAETDLRACAQCKWTQCRRCWDYLNGQCSHCFWSMPNLPKALLPFLALSRPVQQAASQRRS
jgi:hypothetical protein